MPYFVMTCEGVYPSASIGTGPDMNDAPWFLGRSVTPSLPPPLVYTLNPDRLGNIQAMYDDHRFPLMRDDLVAALQAVGVDNLELFDAVIRDPSTGEDHANYKAFNIIGLVAAADMQGSVLMGTSDSTLIDADFEQLAIDEKKAAPFRLFRLAESVSTIIVDQVVKDEVERRGIEGMEFYDPADWSG